MCIRDSLNTMLFADDQFVIQDSEDKLQLVIHKLNVLSKGYNFSILIEKTKTMAFLGKDSIWEKIIIENKISEQVSRFNVILYMKKTKIFLLKQTTSKKYVVHYGAHSKERLRKKHK